MSEPHGREGKVEPRLRVSYAGITHTGLVRGHNEDAFMADSPVFLVADGMGGHRYGGRASRVALEAFVPLVGRPFVSAADLERCLAQAAQSVTALGQDSVAPGSTLTGMVLSLQGEHPCLRVVNIGDSRTYHLSREAFSQLTKDHSHVQELVDAGFIRPEEARTRSDRSVITRALGAGTGPDVQVDQVLVPAVEQDRLLLCSDGLSGMVPDPQIEDVLRQEPDPQAAVDKLLALALAAGGSDNITAVVVDVQEVSPRWSHTDVDSTTCPQRAWRHDTIPNSSVFNAVLEERA